MTTFRHVALSAVVIALAVACPPFSYGQVVDCDTIGNCQFPDPDYGGDPSPAIFFSVDVDGMVHVNLALYIDNGCTGDPIAMGAADLPVTAGFNGFYLSWGGMPPPVGFQYSIGTTLGTCDTVCLNYTHAIDPPSCIGGADLPKGGDLPGFEPLPSP